MSVVGAAAHPAGRISLSRGPLAVVDLHPTAETRSAVVLVPGYTGSKEDFEPIADLVIAAGRRFVAIDQRGQHDSPGPDDLSAYSVDALGEELLELRARLGDGPVHLVGHSFGGLVARSAVLRDPAAYRSLTLLCSGPAAVAGATAERVAMLRGLMTTMSLAEISDLAEATDPVAAARPAEVRAFLRARFLATSVASLRGMGESILSEPDRVEELRAAGVPVLVAHGEDDDAWAPAVQRDMAQRLGAAYAVLPGAAHSPAVEAPARTAACLEAFWSGLEHPAS